DFTAKRPGNYQRIDSYANVETRTGSAEEFSFLQERNVNCERIRFTQVVETSITHYPHDLDVLAFAGIAYSDASPDGFTGGKKLPREFLTNDSDVKCRVVILPSKFSAWE